jgi:hypothetical protein
MNCCGPTRRQALLWSGLVASGAALATGGPAAAAGAPTAGDLLVQDVEVVTVTDTSVIITWFTGSPTAQDAFGFPEPVAADTELQLGAVDPTTLTIVPGSLKTVFHDPAATPYHYAEVTGRRRSRRTPGCRRTRRSCSRPCWATCARPTARRTGCWWRAT